MYIIVEVLKDDSVALRKPQLMFSTLFKSLSPKEEKELLEQTAAKIIPSNHRWFIYKEKNLPSMKNRDNWKAKGKKIYSKNSKS